MMNKADMKAYRDQLIALRARLRGDVNNMAESALKKRRSESSGDLSSMPIHMADLGTDNFEQEFTLTLMESDEGTLGLIEAALERVEDGTYGQCEEMRGTDSQGPAERHPLRHDVRQVRVRTEQG